MTYFYGSRQQNEQNVSHYSCMFEGIIGKYVVRGIVHRSEAMLLNGLKTSLKDISGHKYDTIKDFGGLRFALRQIEYYHIPQEST